MLKRTSHWNKCSLQKCLKVWSFFYKRAVCDLMVHNQTPSSVYWKATSFNHSLPSLSGPLRSLPVYSFVTKSHHQTVMPILWVLNICSISAFHFLRPSSEDFSLPTWKLAHEDWGFQLWPWRLLRRVSYSELRSSGTSPPIGSLFTRLAHLIVSSFRKRRLAVPWDASFLHKSRWKIGINIYLAVEELPNSNHFTWVERNSSYCLPVSRKYSANIIELCSWKKLSPHIPRAQ